VATALTSRPGQTPAQAEKHIRITVYVREILTGDLMRDCGTLRKAPSVDPSQGDRRTSLVRFEPLPEDPMT